MWQKLLTIVAASSLILSAAIAVFWIRSYWRADVITFRSFRVEGAGANSRSLLAVSTGARLVVSTDTNQMIPVGPVPPLGSPVTFIDPYPEGWSFFVSPAPYPLPLSSPLSQPQFDALGLRVELKRGTGSWTPDGKVQTRWTSKSLAIPHWMMVLIGLMAPAWWWFLRRQRLLRLERLNRGLCVRCGYDLRASLQGGRCPECGTIPTAPLIDA